MASANHVEPKRSGWFSRLQKIVFGTGQEGNPLQIPANRELLKQSCHHIASLLQSEGITIPARDKEGGLLIPTTSICDIFENLHVQKVGPIWKVIRHTFETLQNTDGSRWPHTFLLEVMCSIIKGQYSHINILRSEFFTVISQAGQGDFYLPLLRLRMQALTLLTSNGRTIAPFHDEIGPLLESIVSFEELKAAGPEGIEVFLVLVRLVIEVIKYNFTQIQESSMAGLIEAYSSVVQRRDVSVQIMAACISLLDVVVRYGYFPPSCNLKVFLSALCHAVNEPSLSDTSWQ